MKKYDSYKDSGIEWIGEIPSHWEIKRLKNIGKLYSGLSGKSGSDFEKTPTENYKPFINFTNIANNKYVVNDNFGYVKIDEHENQNKVKKNDLFFLMSSENQEDVGKSALLLEDYDELYLNSFCKGFRLNNNLDARFINYLLTSSALSQLISLEGRGFTRINLRMEGVENLPMILPKSTEEQITISNYLDQKTTEIDDLIAKKERLIQLLEEERTAIINQAVTKGLDPTVPMKDTGIEWLGEIPAHWNKPRMKHICDFILDGTHGSFNRVENGYRLLSVRNIINNEFVFREDDSKVSEEDFEIISKRFLIQKEDIQLAIVGATLGKVAIVGDLPEKIVTQRSLATIRVNNEKCNPKYLFYFVLSEKFQTYLWLNAGFSAQPGVYLGTLQNSTIPLPDLKTQNQIVDFISEKSTEIEAIFSKTNQEIELLKEYKTALISEVVTGKVDVREEKIN